MRYWATRSTTRRTTAFFENLRDGTRLCGLLNHIHPKKVIDESKMTTREQIDRIEEKSGGRASESQCIANIMLFTVARNENHTQTYPFTNRHLLKCCGAGSHRRSNRTLVVQSMYELAVILYRFAKRNKNIRDIPAIDGAPFQKESAEADDVNDVNDADDAKEADASTNDFVPKGRESNGVNGQKRGTAGRRGKKDGFRNSSAKQNIRAQKRAKQSKYALKPGSDDEY